ncbi:MAG: DUF262 domain-containing protein [Fibrobacteraceae bacterium]|nr:DUF262 domain-containing protein [Fibrobacteraceae bacterium]
MQIHLKEITVRELVDNFQNSEEEGVYGYGGKLNIRPKYQREFVYKKEQQQAVIETISKNYPLNVMYWVLNPDGTYELLDGQQRTLSICSFYMGEFMVSCFQNTLQGYNNLSPEDQNAFLSYKLMVYVCENGTDKEKLDWFRVINIAGEVLTEQEIRNAVYSGSWVTAAKKKFSKTGCVAYKLGKDYMSGSPIRQDYLETVISWISEGKIEEYMASHQLDANADELWDYFTEVIAWVKTVFPKYRKEMKGLPWGVLYNTYKDGTYDAEALEEEVKKLMADSDVTKKGGIYTYVFDHKEKHLSIRAFDDNTKRSVYERQNGICNQCYNHFEIEEMEADHITPWSQGGRTIDSNCQMLCKDCNRRKSGR